MKTCFNRINLNQEITTRNYIGCLIHYFMLSFIFVSIDSLQPLLLQNSFNINRKDQIQNFDNALVIAFDIVVKLICAPIFGYLTDKYGRRNIAIYGIIVIALCMTAMPYSPSFWVYAGLRCIYAHGAIAISVVPLLADYVSPKSRGKCAALLVFMSSIGALASAFINFTILDKINSDVKLRYQYGVIAVLIILIGLLYTIFCLKKGNTYYSKKQKKRTISELYAVAKTSFTHPQISTGFISAFLARGDSILLSLYLVLWTYSFSTDKNFQESSKTASMLSGITYAIIMFTCIIYGIFYERKKSYMRNLMISMLGLAMVGAFAINISNQVLSIMTYASLSILGFGMSGLLTASIFLVSQYSTPENRGFLTGLQTFFGVVGITLQTILGAVLFEYGNRNGPFNYFGVTCAVGIFLTILVYWRAKKMQPKQLPNNQNDSLVEPESIENI